ncbi:MAG: DUF2569 family protein, partial [Bacteroidales bacterium]|nr:DUF2569 family protein [Bacteroidales bacterium]
VGDVIEYAYTLKGSNPVFEGNYINEFYLEYGVPMKQIFLQITYPRERKIQYKLFKTREKPTKAIKNGQVTLTWNFSDVSEVVTNSELPGWYSPYAKVQFSEFGHWKEVIKWGENLFPQVDIKGTSLGEKFHEITKGLNNQQEKINALIRFVQDEVRYVGIEANVNSHKPHPPQEVFTKRYGDCKDKTYLLVTLLRHLGEKAWPAYVNTIVKHQVKEHLPSPIVFNHAIVAIENEDALYFVDPTFSNQEGDFRQAYSGNYQTALVVDNAKNGPVDIPLGSKEKIIIHEKIESIDTIQPAKYIVESTYMGSEADQIRTSFRTRTRKETESAYLDFYDYVYPSMRLVDEVEMTDNKEDNIVKTKEHFEIDEFWTYDDSPAVNDYFSIITPTNLRYYISEPEQKNRDMPYSIYHPIEIENKIEFINTKEFSVEETQGEISNPSFHFSYNISHSGKKVTFDYRYKSLKDHVTVADFDDYYKDVEEIINSTWYRFTYGKDGEAPTGSSTNWLMVIISIFFVIILVYIAEKFYRKDVQTTNPPEKPLKIGGWLLLPTIGLLISPFISLYNLFSADYFTQESWEFISSASSAGYNKIWSATYIIELLANILLVVYTFFLIIILFKRRTIFPIHYVVFRILFLLFIVTDTILVEMIDSEYFFYQGPDIKKMVQATAAAAIWVPYMFISQRVKNTFVVRFNSSKKLKD